MIYTIKQFIKSGVHLGHYKWECDYRLSYFLLGVRNSIHIINLYYTLFILKQGLYIAYNMCILNQRILIASNVGFKLTTNFEKINKKKLTYINNKWVGGLLSNQKVLYLNNEEFFLKVYNLGYNSLLPSYVFASNTKQTTSCIFEAITLNIPCSTLLDSNIGYYGIFYAIPSNDDNFVTIYLFTRLFIKIYIKSIYDNIKNLKILIKNYKKIKFFKKFKKNRYKKNKKNFLKKSKKKKENFLKKNEIKENFLKKNETKENFLKKNETKENFLKKNETKEEYENFLKKNETKEEYEKFLKNVTERRLKAVKFFKNKENFLNSIKKK